MATLSAGANGWMTSLLSAFNAGDVNAYREVTASNAAAMQGQPELVAEPDPEVAGHHPPLHEADAEEVPQPCQSHWKGLSPVWVRRCRLSAEVVAGSTTISATPISHS